MYSGAVTVLTLSNWAIGGCSSQARVLATSYSTRGLIASRTTLMLSLSLSITLRYERSLIYLPFLLHPRYSLSPFPLAPLSDDSYRGTTTSGFLSFLVNGVRIYTTNSAAAILPTGLSIALFFPSIATTVF